MGLIEKIRSFFKKEQVITSTNITRYDTSSISIPKYSELSENAKKIVDGYIEEVEFEKLDTLMLYADEMSEYANANTELLLKLFFRVTQKPLESELRRLPDEEIAERRLDALIQREEVGLYKQGLENLQKESTLRAVALEEIKRRESKRKFDFLGLFGRAERLKRKNQMELLELATERMKISKKTIEQQIAVVINEIESEENISTSLDVYNAIQRSSNETLDDTALRKRAHEMIPIASLVIPNEVNTLQRKKCGIYFNKKDVVEVLARVQRKLDVYAYTHRNDLEQLRQEVVEIRKQVKTIKSREELLNRVNRIQTMYKVFGQYVTPEDLQSLYQAKFNVLTIGANEQEESPFEEIKDKEEIAYYGAILESKLEAILQGRNAYFANEFGKNQSKAIQIVREIIKKENGDYSGEKLLHNTRLMLLILAFDEGKSGIMRLFSMTNVFSKNDLSQHLDDGTISWTDKLPLETICDLENSVGNLDKKNISSWVKLILLTSLKSKYIYRLGYGIPGEFHLPEGITRLSFTNNDLHTNRYEYEIIESLKSIAYSRKIICPSTLRKIKSPEFMSKLSNYTQIKFNENLEEIDNGAFEKCDFSCVSFPKSLRRIGIGAFEGCKKLESVYINEEMKNIGQDAFANTPSLKVFSVPTHKINIENSIFGDERSTAKGERTIALIVRSLNIEEGCLEQYLHFDIRRIKSIEIMDRENVAIRYNILDSDDSENVVKKVEQLIQEYKQRKMNKPQQQGESR